MRMCKHVYMCLCSAIIYTHMLYIRNSLHILQIYMYGAWFHMYMPSVIIYIYIYIYNIYIYIIYIIYIHIYKFESHLMMCCIKQKNFLKKHIYIYIYMWCMVMLQYMRCIQRFVYSIVIYYMPQVSELP